MAADSYPEGSRIFIGNLASEATSKKELRAIFEAYGPVDEVILHESYGFIQFHTPEAAANAIGKESGRSIGGRRIDVQLSKRDRNRDRDDRRGRGRSPPRRESYRDDRRHDSPRRDSAYDRRPGSPDRRYSGRERDARGEYGYDRRPGDDRRGSVRSRSDRPRSPGGYGSRDYLPRRDRSRSPIRRPGDDFRRDSRYGSEPRRDGAASAARRVLDCCVVAVSRDQRHYANYVMNRIVDTGIREVDIVLAERPVPAELNGLIARNIPFACVVGPNDEANRTVSLSLLKRNPPEDVHGVPVDEALRILNKELLLYKEAQAEIARAASLSGFPQGAPFAPVGMGMSAQMPQPMMGGVPGMPGMGQGMPPAMPTMQQPHQQQAPMMNVGPVPGPGPMSGPQGMGANVGNMGPGMVPHVGGGIPLSSGGMGGGMANGNAGLMAPSKDNLDDEQELLKKQAEIQASILNILQQSGGAAQGQPNTQQMGQPMMQPFMGLASQGQMVGGAGSNAPRDPRLQAYQAPGNQMMQGQYGGQSMAPADPRNSYSQASQVSPHMGAQPHMQQMAQQPTYAGQGQPPMLSSSSNPDVDKAFNDLMMLKQKGFFDKRQ